MGRIQGKSMSMIEQLRLWFSREESSLIALNLRATFSSGPEDRDPRSAWLDLDSEHRVGRLILWETGAAELSVGDVETGEMATEEHREITSTLGLQDAIQSLIAWVK
jgi:hypothetical protein